MKNFDKKALQILKNYIIDASKISQEDWKYACVKGYIIDYKQITHQQIIESIYKNIHLLNQKQLTDCFLASLSTRRLDWRIGLSAYALARLMPFHNFTQSLYFSSENCKICGSIEIYEHQLIQIANLGKLTCGSISSQENILEMMFCLENVVKNIEVFENVQPQLIDFEIFNQIVEIIKTSQKNDTISAINKKIANIKDFKSNFEERRGILETLGYCSILETPSQKGFHENFTNWENRQQGNIRNDWQYPVIFWKGENGINQEAFNFFFGAYPEISMF